MIKSVKVHVLRVFVNEQGDYGNPVGIMVDENRDIHPDDRQRIATELGYSESVFIHDIATGKVSIFNPRQEVNFAGHALVGTAYLINQILKQPIHDLTCNIGKIKTWQENNQTWIRAGLTGTPPWNFKQLQTALLVNSLPMTQVTTLEHTIIWAWMDEDEGIVRARTFAPDWGIPEDEANGSGAMQLALMTKRAVEIHHGQGSVIYAQPEEQGYAEVGGRVTQVGYV